MKHLTTLLAILISLNAQEIDINSDFLSSLDEVSEIATKTKLNIDESPSFVTVLRSEKLKKLGVSNVIEALSLVPGVQVKKESSGVYVVVFRGATQKGEVKLMVDGVSINNAYRGSIYYYLDFPIELISRIEVIRGPGSVLYGSGAISGVINIITHNAQDSKNDLFVSGGTYDTYKAGAVLSTTVDTLKVNLDTYFTKSNKTIQTGPDSDGNIGDSDQRIKDYSVGLNLSNENLSFLARIKKIDHGASHGIFSVLDVTGDSYNHMNESIFTQLSYNRKISQNNKVNIKTGYISYKQDLTDQYSVGTAVPVSLQYKEDSFFAQAELISKSIDKNEFIIGTSINHFNLKNVDVRVNNSPLLLVDKTSDRDVFSLYFSDNYTVNDFLILSAGARYEDYSDFGDSLVPNIGGVLKIGEKIRVKANYSESYRAPSWIELTSNKNLDSEEAKTCEVGFVYKQSLQNTFRINAYATKIKGIITKIGADYRQESENKFLGTELEYIYSPNSKAELTLSASYIDAKDEDGKRLPDVANKIASTSFIYEFDSGITTGSILKYLSSSSRTSADVRGDFDDSIVFNQTISYNLEKFTFSLIVNDLFNNGKKYPSLPNTYMNDYTDEDRTITLKASMEF